MFTASGLFILCVSSLFQAIQAVVEQAIFMRDPGLSPWPLCGAEAFWKIIIIVGLSPLYSYIHVPTAISYSGTLENFSLAFGELAADNDLLQLVVVNGALVGLSHAFGYAIIKYETAVLQTTITLSIIFTTWLFFLLWPYKGHSSFNALTLLGMLMLASGSYWYIVADHKQNKEHNGSNDLESSMSFLEQEPIAPYQAEKRKTGSPEVIFL